MRKTEVYQVRLDSQEKSRLLLFLNNWELPLPKQYDFFKQVVLTKSIPFAIENQNINMEQLLKLRKAKASSLNQNSSTIAEDDDHEDLFEELNALLGESDKT